MLSHRRARCRRLRSCDERGAFTLVELIVAAATGIIVLFIATGMLTSMLTLSFGETNKNDTQIRGRQTVETAMRYLKNAVPLADCERFKTGAPAGISKLSESDVSTHCAKYGALTSQGGAAVIRASSKEVEFYAMPEGAKPGQSPNRYVMRMSGTSLEVVMKAPAATGQSTVAAACADLGGGAIPGAGCASQQPNPSGFWGGETTLASVDLGAWGSFQITYLDKNGNAVTSCTNCSEIRTVLVDGSVSYIDRNRAQQSMAIRAEASIRSSTYADRAAEGG